VAGNEYELELSAQVVRGSWLDCSYEARFAKKRPTTDKPIFVQREVVL